MDLYDYDDDCTFSTKYEKTSRSFQLCWDQNKCWDSREGGGVWHIRTVDFLFHDENWMCDIRYNINIYISPNHAHITLHEIAFNLHFIESPEIQIWHCKTNCIFFTRNLQQDLRWRTRRPWRISVWVPRGGSQAAVRRREWADQRNIWLVQTLWSRKTPPVSLLWSEGARSERIL